MTNDSPSTKTGADSPEIRTMVDVLDRAAEASPDHVAIICDDDRITYRGYRHGAAAFARDLQGLDCKGERVVVLMGNSIETSMAIYAVWAAGGVIVLLNPLFTEHELGPLIRDAGPRVVLCDGAHYERIAPIASAAGVDTVVPLGAGGTTFDEWLGRPESPLPEPRPAASDMASLQFTGGTTGVPKGARHTHERIVHTTRMIDSVWPEESPGADIWLDVAPQFHIWGLCMTALTPTYRRDTLVLIRQFRPDLVLAAMSRHEVTLFAGGPSAIYHGLMGHPDFKTTDYSSLRLCAGGGSPFAIETVRAWEAVTGCTVHEGYGMSEGAPISLNRSPGTPKVGTCGPPLPGTEVGIVDVETGNRTLAPGEDGEIRVRGPQMMDAYWQRPEETAETVRSGWIYTGDIGHLDEDGHIVIVDRKKDMAIVSGFNVFPREIDEVLFAHPDILEAAALGVPDDRMGEVVHAYVVPQSGADLRPEAVIAYCAEQLVKHKVPAAVFVVDALPKTPAAKIDKRALRERSTRGEGPA